MKRFFIALSLFCILLASTVFASGRSVPSTITKSFQTSFPSAKNVSWSEQAGFSIADFTLEDKKLSAYFDNNGSLIVVAEQIFENQLPRLLQQSLVKEYGDHIFTSIFKMQRGSELSYYIVATKNQKQIILSSATDKWIKRS
jgi:hypothetical protein